MITIGITSSRASTSGISSSMRYSQLREFLLSVSWHLGKSAERETSLAFAFGELGDQVNPMFVYDISVRRNDQGELILDIPMNTDFLPRSDSRYQVPILISRNPVGYVSTAGESCACGCGEETNKRRDFLPGHDQRAIHDRIKKYFGGSTLKAIHELDRVFGASE